MEALPSKGGGDRVAIAEIVLIVRTIMNFIVLDSAVQNRYLETDLETPPPSGTGVQRRLGEWYASTGCHSQLLGFVDAGTAVSDKAFWL